MWDLWWTKWNGGQIFSEYFGYPSQFTFHRLFHNDHRRLSSGVGTVGQTVAAVPSGPILNPWAMKRKVWKMEQLWLVFTLCTDICIKDLNTFLSVSFHMKYICVHFSTNQHFILVMFPWWYVSLRHYSEFYLECLRVYVYLMYLCIFNNSKNLTEMLQ
jgi:hypothetical protein